MKWRTPRGIRDIPPEEYEKMLKLLDIFRELCHTYGYRIMEPATIELFEVLSLKSGEEIKNEIYEFKDKAGRHLGLRFDLTVGITRYVTSRPEIPKPIKIGAYSVQWRYDEPQRGRYRSFYAWDIEIYGGEEILSTIETVQFSYDMLNRSGLKHFIIYLSDRRLVEDILKTRFNVEKPEDIMRIMDKWGKRKENEIISMMVKEGLSNETAKEIIELFFYERNEERFRDFKTPLFEVRDILKNDLGIKNVEINPGIVRGLDYYDGIVFEIKKDEKSLTLVGGGSYTTLVRLFGGNFTAFGAAGGVERLIIELNGKQTIQNREGVYIIPISKEMIKPALELARQLRKKGIRTDYPLTIRGIDKNLRYAAQNNYKYAIFLGEKEIDKGYLTVKNLETREESKVEINKIYNFITKQL